MKFLCLVRILYCCSDAFELLRVHITRYNVVDFSRLVEWAKVVICLLHFFCYFYSMCCTKLLSTVANIIPCRIDDIEDSSDRRRGKPAAHMLFGVPLSINAANYAYFIALEKALTLEHPDVPKIFASMHHIFLTSMHIDRHAALSFICSALKCGVFRYNPHLLLH